MVYHEIYRNLSERQMIKIIFAIRTSDIYLLPEELPDGKLNHVTSKEGEVLGYLGENGIELYSPEEGLFSNEHWKFAKFCQKQLGRIPKGISLEKLADSNFQ